MNFDKFHSIHDRYIIIELPKGHEAFLILYLTSTEIDVFQRLILNGPNFWDLSLYRHQRYGIYNNYNSELVLLYYFESDKFDIIVCKRKHVAISHSKTEENLTSHATLKQ